MIHYIDQPILNESREKTIYQHGEICLTKKTKSLGRRGGQVLSVLAFYSDNPSSIPLKLCKNGCLKDQKRSRVVQFLKNKIKIIWRNT